MQRTAGRQGSPYNERSDEGRAMQRVVGCNERAKGGGTWWQKHLDRLPL